MSIITNWDDLHDHMLDVEDGDTFEFKNVKYKVEGKQEFIEDYNHDQFSQELYAMHKDEDITSFVSGNKVGILTILNQ